MNIYWPGTKIVKSRGNAFDWRQEPSAVLSSHDWKSSESARRQSVLHPGRSFTVYSKAKAKGAKP
jgi:hypothetical protein